MFLRTSTFQAAILAKWDLMLKWCINFLALLVVYGSGQRNQVYTFLKCPDISYVEDFVRAHDDGSGHEPLKLHIHEREKRVRDSRLPFIMLDPVTAPYISFHTQFFQPLLLKRYNKELGTVDGQKLLLDTKNGSPLSSNNVRHSFRRWVKDIDNELSITPMDIRSGYATMMIRPHARRNDESRNDLVSFKT